MYSGNNLGIIKSITYIMNIILSYVSCNKGSLISLTFILPFMIIAIMIMKLFVDGEIYKDRYGCWPISFYFGETNGCRRIIYKNVNASIDKAVSETFENRNNNSYFQELFSGILNIISKINTKISNIFNQWVVLNEFIRKSISLIIQEKLSLSLT